MSTASTLQHLVDNWHKYSSSNIWKITNGLISKLAEYTEGPVELFLARNDAIVAIYGVTEKDLFALQWNNTLLTPLRYWKPFVDGKAGIPFVSNAESIAPLFNISGEHIRVLLRVLGYTGDVTFLTQKQQLLLHNLLKYNVTKHTKYKARCFPLITGDEYYDFYRMFANLSLSDRIEYILTNRDCEINPDALLCEDEKECTWNMSDRKYVPVPDGFLPEGYRSVDISWKDLAYATFTEQEKATVHKYYATIPDKIPQDFIPITFSEYLYRRSYDSYNNSSVVESHYSLVEIGVSDVRTNVFDPANGNDLRRLVFRNNFTVTSPSKEVLSKENLVEFSFYSPDYKQQILFLLEFGFNDSMSMDRVLTLTSRQITHDIAQTICEYAYHNIKVTLAPEMIEEIKHKPWWSWVQDLPIHIKGEFLKRNGNTMTVKDRIGNPFVMMSMFYPYLAVDDTLRDRFDISTI